MTIFEKIIAGEIPANKIYEDEETFAFLDASPVNPGHTLVISKEAYKDIEDTPPEVLAAVIKTVQKLAPQIKKAVEADGFNIIQNNSAAAGQEVFHLHFHIIPRFEGDGFSHWHGAENYHEDERGTKIAEKITESL